MGPALTPTEFLSYSLAGLLVGISVGLTGIGGGSMMAPLLILVFNVPAARAVQLDFLYLVPTKLAAAWQHQRGGTVDRPLAVLLALGALPGTAIGSLYVSHAVAGNPALELQLRRLIGLFVLASAILLLAQLAIMWRRHAPSLEVRTTGFSLVHGALIVLLGAGVGVFVGATSIGAGSILLPLLVLLLRVHMRRLVSTDVVVGALMAIVGAAIHGSAQAVPWPIVAALLLGSLPGALLGARLVGIVSTRLVRGAVAGALLMSGLILTGTISAAT